MQEIFVSPVFFITHFKCDMFEVWNAKDYSIDKRT